jgi:hypothetical protein
MGGVPRTPFAQAVTETIDLFRQCVANGRMAPDEMLK